MENIVCQFCKQEWDEPVLLQCKHHVCSKCLHSQFSFDFHRKPCDGVVGIVKQTKASYKKRTVNICCPVCKEKTISISSQGNSKLANDQQLSAVNDGLVENQQQQHIPDEMFQWMFQFLNTTMLLFTKIRFTCQRIDKIVCTSLLSLNFQGLCINGLKFGSTILPMKTQLQELNLMANNIGDNEATQIAIAFRLMQQLQILDLSWNQIGITGASAIANSITHLKQLQVLDISCNPIDDSGIAAIFDATKQLTRLQKLEIYEKCSQTMFKHVQQVFNEKGTKLDLNDCDADDESAIALAKMLPHLAQLQELLVDDNRIGDTGTITIANSISNLAQLQLLNLNYNQISNTGTIALSNSLSNLTQLQQLYLGSNQIGDIGATVIANSISNCTRLNYLHLQNNNISEPVKQQLKQLFGKKLDI